MHNPGAAQANLTSPVQVRTLLQQLGIRPNKTLGQNFLIDRNILDILVETARLQPHDGVLEIGPGLGVVTERLVAQAARVLAVEKDQGLALFLREHFAHCTNLEIVHGDALEQNGGALVEAGFTKVVSNLPYACGTRILVNLIQANPSPTLFAVTLQREVAERMVAAAGAARRGMLSVWLQLDYTVEIMRQVKPTCFWPRPEVASAIVRAVKRPGSRLDGAQRAVFVGLTRQAFSCRRKQIITILKGWRGLESREREEIESLLARADIDRTARPEDLTVEAWCRLAEVVSALPHGTEGGV